MSNLLKVLSVLPSRFSEVFVHPATLFDKKLLLGIKYNIWSLLAFEVLRGLKGFWLDTFLPLHCSKNTTVKGCLDIYFKLKLNLRTLVSLNKGDLRESVPALVLALLISSNRFLYKLHLFFFLANRIGFLFVPVSFNT